MWRSGYHNVYIQMCALLFKNSTISKVYSDNEPITIVPLLIAEVRSMICSCREKFANLSNKMQLALNESVPKPKIFSRDTCRANLMTCYLVILEQRVEQLMYLFSWRISYLFIVFLTQYKSYSVKRKVNRRRFCCLTS